MKAAAPRRKNRYRGTLRGRDNRPSSSSYLPIEYETSYAPARLFVIDESRERVIAAAVDLK